MPQHIAPFSMNAIPPNIFFSCTPRRPDSLRPRGSFV
jgi:hypothetical protein